MELLPPALILTGRQCASRCSRHLSHGLHYQELANITCTPTRVPLNSGACAGAVPTRFVPHRPGRQCASGSLRHSSHALEGATRIALSTVLATGQCEWYAVEPVQCAHRMMHTSFLPSARYHHQHAQASASEPWGHHSIPQPRQARMLLRHLMAAIM